MANGWIKLHRQLQETKLWKRKEPFDMRSAWVDLLMKVNFDDQKIILNKRAVIVKRGQTFTSVRNLAERWHWSKGRVTTYLKLLEELEMVTVDRTTEGTLITVVNYSFYQGDTDTNRDSNKDTTKDTTKDTNRDKNKNNKNKKEYKNKISTFGNYDQREAQEDDIYTILSRKGNK